MHLSLNLVIFLDITVKVGLKKYLKKIKANLCIRLFTTALFIIANIKIILSAHMEKSDWKTYSMSI